MTATVVNIALYIIPLFMLIIGSFSIANEMENGQWRLLTTYPLFTLFYIVGKIGGQFTAQAIVFTFSYGISLGIGLIMGNGFSSDWLLSIYFFCISLIFFFLDHWHYHWDNCINKVAGVINFSDYLVFPHYDLANCAHWHFRFSPLPLDCPIDEISPVSQSC